MDSIPARCRDENGYLVRQSLMMTCPTAAARWPRQAVAF